MTITSKEKNSEHFPEFSSEQVWDRTKDSVLRYLK